MLTDLPNVLGSFCSLKVPSFTTDTVRRFAQDEVDRRETEDHESLKPLEFAFLDKNIRKTFDFCQVKYSKRIFMKR